VTRKELSAIQMRPMPPFPSSRTRRSEGAMDSPGRGSLPETMNGWVHGSIWFLTVS
jgi:hypothetical protein